MKQEMDLSISNKFWKSISNDKPMIKLWKYRFFAKKEPKAAFQIKDKMFNICLKNNLIAEYDKITSIFGQKLQKTEEYHKIKNEHVSIVNQLRTELNHFINTGKTDEELKCLLKTAEYLSQRGDHEEAENYCSKYFRNVGKGNSAMKEVQFLTLWGVETFLMVEDSLLVKSSQNQVQSVQKIIIKKPPVSFENLEFFSIRLIEGNNKVNTSLALLRDIFKLTQKGKGRGKMRIFENLLNGGYSLKDIIENKILSLLDLGYLYSLLGLAYKDRSSLATNVQWSSKIEINYLQNDYLKLFESIKKCYDNYGQFNILIAILYEDCVSRIKKRVIEDLCSGYQQISFMKITKLTGITSYEVQNHIKNNPELPFLIDPISASVVYYQKSVPLFKQTNILFDAIKRIFDSEEKERRKEDKKEDHFESGFGRGFM